MDNEGHCSSISGVFLDVADCPLPKDFYLPSISCNIESLLENLGHYSDKRVEIWAFGENKEIASSDDVHEVKIYYVPEGDRDIQLNLMLFHILGWASMDFRDKTKNLMVIVDRFYLCSSEFVRVLRHLEHRGFNVLSVLPPDEAVSKELLRDTDWISNCTVNTIRMDPRLGGVIPKDNNYIPDDYISDGPMTRVYWDVVDYPIPEDMEPNCIYQKLESALRLKGYINEMSIWAYTDKITFSGLLEKGLVEKYAKSKIYFLPGGGDKNARHNRMINDIRLWIIDSPVDGTAPSNVIVISNNIQGDDVETYGIPRVIDLIYPLKCLYARGYNAFLVQPNLLAPEISQTSEWPGHLLDVGEVIGRYKPDPSQKKRWRKKKKSRKRKTSEPITRVDGPKTGIFWDINDSPLPNDLDPQSMYQKFKSALEEKDYYGEMTIWAYAEKITFSNELLDEYRKANIYFIPEGDKNARHNRIIHDILLWQIDTPLRYPTESNVIVISNNIPCDIDLIKCLVYSAGVGYNNRLVQPNAFSAPEKHKTSEWPGYLLDGGKPIGGIRYYPPRN
ncbi:NYN domain limkain-b1-type [Arabidopsis thaliana x Arabidopsis arenosa]|uniref:NYN domain limkain-b1-type n=1 Tax=Arabidopsis thaliana x Arabidopsis arenosa TaxID=1240361 RepID=A0A8T2A942_9BRAS|nr:NYN domain limkain-b1-type [Arabidopsis thaliana x Arabidopsis arenosa]